jgi:hypothetical protein
MEVETVVAEQKYTILYHGNCIDGWVSAYLAYSTLYTKGPVQLFAISPNQPRTWPTGQEMSGTNILMVDISVPEEYRKKWLAAGALTIMCIDHHATSTEHWTPAECPIHVESCAAIQVHTFFFPDMPIPGWLAAVDRIDRWDNPTEEDRCMREVLSYIAHKPVSGALEEAIMLTQKFIMDMENPEAVAAYLAQGKEVLHQKDEHLKQLMFSRGRMVSITPEMATAWQLPANWAYLTIFVVDNTGITMDTTEAAHLFFSVQKGAPVFINYRKQTYPGKPFPQYTFSARSRDFDMTQGTILKGHPSAAGASIIAKSGVCLPFVL